MLVSRFTIKIGYTFQSQVDVSIDVKKSDVFSISVVTEQHCVVSRGLPSYRRHSKWRGKQDRAEVTSAL